jgi:hypothetical protein
LKSANSVGTFEEETSVLINNNDYFQVLEQLEMQIHNAQYRAFLGTNPALKREGQTDRRICT